MNVNEIAAAIRGLDYWDIDLCKALVEAAGLADAWNDPEAESVEPIVFKAADILGVEIL